MTASDQTPSAAAGPSDGAADAAHALFVALHGRAATGHHPTRAAAMQAAAEWVEAQVGRPLRGALSMRYARARAWAVGMGGQIEVVPLAVRDCPACAGRGTRDPATFSIMPR